MRFSVVVRGQKNSSLTKIETFNTEHTHNTRQTHIECVKNKDETTAKQRKIRLKAINLVMSLLLHYSQLVQTL